MEQPDVVRALEDWAPDGPMHADPMRVTYFLSRETVVRGRRERGVDRWRDRVFATMARNAGSVTDFFRIPDNRVVELGTRVQM